MCFLSWKLTAQMLMLNQRILASRKIKNLNCSFNVCSLTCDLLTHDLSTQNTLSPNSLTPNPKTKS